MNTETTGTRFVPWCAFILGAAASIAANVAHAAARADEIGPGGMLAAGWAPVALLLVAEMVTRGNRPAGLVAVVQWGGTAIVAVVAAVVSYGHMRDLLLSYGETDLVAHLLPLSVDGLLLVASVALARPVTSTVPDVPPAPADTPDTGKEVAATAPHRNEDLDDVETDPYPVPHPVPVRAAEPEPEAITVPVPDEHAEARQAYRSAVAAGRNMTGKELAERFGRSDRWGRARIRECRDQTREPALTGAAVA